MTSALAVLFTLFASPAFADTTVLVTEAARVTVRWDHGAVSIVRVEREPLPSPTRLQRWRGRVEARAVGRESKALDFVRFDFPLMAEAEAEDATDQAHVVGDKLRKHVTVATTIVRVPLPAGTTSVAIYDGVTKKSATAALPAPAPPAGGGAGSTKR